MSSYSDYDTFARCPLSYKYRVVESIQPKKTQASLHEGTVQHKVQELGMILLRDYPEDRNWPLDDYYDSLGALLLAEMQEGKELRFPAEQSEYEDLWHKCLRRFQRWFEFHDCLERWEILHVEEQFTLVVDGREVTCTPDLVVRDRYTGGVWVVDLKSTSTVPDTDEPTLQTYINLAAVKTVYPDTVGFMFDYLRKKEPTEPALVKDGSRVGNLNRIDTDYRTLSDFIAETKPELFDDAAHKERLAELRVSDQDKWFKRFPFHVGDETLDLALDDLMRQAQVMDTVQENELWYRVVIKSGGYRDCSRCGYKTICDTDLTGGDRDRVLQQFYEPRDLSYKDYETEEEI